MTGSEVHLQCDVVQCSGGCADDEVCPGDTLTASINKGGRALGSKSEDGMLLAATTVFVLDPSEAPRKYSKRFVFVAEIIPAPLIYIALVSAICLTRSKVVLANFFC